MTRSGFRNIRGAIKSERAFYAHWEKKQREKLLKHKYGIKAEKKVDDSRVRSDGRTDRA